MLLAAILTPQINVQIRRHDMMVGLVVVVVTAARNETINEHKKSYFKSRGKTYLITA